MTRLDLEDPTRYGDEYLRFLSIDAPRVDEVRGNPILVAMARVKIDKPAPDFTAADVTGREIHLSDWKGRPVVLVFNRGFF